MSEENVEIVRQAWRAYDERGVDGLLDLFAEDCVCEDFPEMPDRAVYKGREGVRSREEHFRAVFGDLAIDPVEFIDADDIVITVVSIRGQGGSSGAPVDAPTAFVSELRNGKVVRDRAFRTRSAALEAAGLEEWGAT